MPRRKQGQSKETTGGEIKKKTDSSRETNQYDPTEQASAQKELVSQVAELSSTPAAGSFRNGSTDGSSPVIVSNRSDDDSMKSVNGKTINIQICDVLSRNCFLPQNDGVIKTSDKALNGIESIETSEGRIAINGNKVSPEKVIVNHMPVNQNVSCLNKILFNTDVTDPAVTTSVHCDGQDLRAKKKFKVATRDEKSDCGAVVSQNTVTEQPYYLHKVLHQHVEGSLNPVIHNENDRNDHNLEVSTVQMGIVSDDCAINGVTKNKVVYNDCGENSGEMSGLSPALIRNTHQGNLSDSHQLNYRISSSVIETKASMSSDILSLLPNKENNLILEDQGFQLPSSVYGTSSSSIETVLTGLCLFSGQEIKCIPNSLSSPENENSSQKFEDSLCVSVNDDDGMKNNSGISSSKEDFQKAEQSSLDSKLKSWDPKNDTKDREKNSASILSNQNLKLFIPNRAQAINQSSPQQQLTESSKNIKFPQITSPQILEQHISKIISENAAIVETLDPLWSRRYLRQSSVSSNNGDFKKINNGPQTRSLGEEKQTNLVSSENICHSKLQTALLGGLHADNRGPLPVTPSTASAFSCKSVPLEMSPFLQCNSSASLPTGKFFSKIGSSTVSEEELQGSAIKSLLSLKQGKFSCHKNSVYFSKEVSQKHPQNPEGSIIKDLLLKNKSKVESKATASSDEEDISSTNVGKGTSNTEDAPDGTLYLFHCTGCKDQFKTKDDVDGHVAHCKAISDIKNTVEDYSESCPSLLNRCSSFVSFSEEKLVKNFSKLLNLPASSSDEQNFVSKGVKLFDSSDEDATGHLLKKQLLSPLSRRKTLTSKKRKISEPVISMNRQDNALIYQIPETYLNAKVVFSQPLEDISASAHRCRSQSVHLFGGEVQILDGIQTKKMKISTNLQSVFSSPQNMFSNGSPFKKSMSGVLEKFKDHPITMPTVVVTIAQPVHNSGGTVTHLPTLTPPPSISPVVTLSNHLMPAGVEKFSDLSLPLSKSLLNSTSFDSPTFQTLTGHPIRRCEADIVGQSRNQCDILSSFSGCTLSPSSSKSAVSFGDMNSPLHLNFPAVSVEMPLSSSNFIFKGRNSFFNENSFDSLKSTAPPKPFAPVNSQQQSFSEHIHNLSTNTKPCKVEETIALDFQSSKSYVIPMVTFTPSSPTHPSSFDKEESGENTDGEKVSNKKFLAPTRPTSLPLKKKPFTMVGSTLISPETPRPKKSCVQLYLNGHAYTYLGLKCSTRSTYCCIYRPQPMYVLQDTNPKLSMYSNWQVVPAKEELSGMTPGQMISFYNLRQGLKCSKSISTAAKLPEPLSFTHSSYWVYRAQEQEKQAAQEEIHALQIKMDSISVDQDPISCHSQSVRPSQDVSMECDGMSQSSLHSENNDNALEETKEDERPASVENSNFSVDTDAASSDLEESHDVDIHDSDVRDDSSEALGNADLPQPPKRVRIFEGGFKSNEDYTYVRGRGRGKYVCEECGIRCKKPSMLKKHIRTHTDLRPYKCRHCSFAFKTKGNLTKHMKSKAHHKKCTELGIVPVPTTTDDSQIDEEALAKQEQLERKNIQFSDNDDIDDDDDDEIDDECDDSDVIDEDCESDSGMMSASSNNRSLPNGYSMKCNTWENVNDDQFDDSSSKRSNSAQTIVEQEAAHSLLHLSVLGETSQWSNSTGEMVSITPPPRDIETEFHTNVVLSQPSLAISPQHHSPPVSASISGTEVHANVDQASVLWLTPEPLGHRPRSYSADIPFSSHREPPDKLQQKNDITQKVFENLPELGTREQYGRRYSISVASEARRPNRMMHTSQWGNSSFISSGLNKWPEMDSSDQPMDLTVSRANNAKKLRPDYDPMVCGVSSAVLTVQTLDNHHESTDESLSEQFQPKTIPVLSPQILIGCDNGGENGNSDIGLPVTSEEHQPYSTNPPLSRPPVFYLPDIGLAENTLERKEMEMTEGEASPEPPDYAACSPVTPPSQEENAYFYAQEGLTGSQATNSQEEMPPASACHAEFIVPSTSSGMDEGRCVCRICNKVFAKSSQLRLHVNIHYFERPFRCDNCAVSFRTKGHLQKHKRSVSHYNKVNMNMTFGTPTVDNPRPFKCADCKIAFRIHGHLAKHLRSKMHIMKLECLGKLPFGMYAEMERSGVSLNEIDTTDCSNSLESLQSMATRLYEKDPRRMRWHNPEHLPVELESAKPTTSLPSAPNLATNVEQLPSASFSIPVSISIPTPSIISINPQGNSDSEVKREPSDLDTFRTTNFSDNTSPVSPPVQYAVPQNSVSQELPRRLEGEVDSSASLNRSGTCHICGRLFKSAKFLQVHLYSDHSTWNPPAVGDMPSQTSANIISGHSPVVSELACDLCGRHFPNQTSLQQHLLSHAQPRPFVCEICDAGFTSATLLASHLTTHQSVSTTNTACSESGLVQLR